MSDGEGAGKGDDPRPIKKSVWDKNFEKALNDHREPEDFQKAEKIKIVYPKTINLKQRI